MKTINVSITERVFYSLTIEVADNATNEQIEAAAEEAFVQGDYRVVSQDEREVVGWDEVS